MPHPHFQAPPPLNSTLHLLKGNSRCVSKVRRGQMGTLLRKGGATFVLGTWSSSSLWQGGGGNLYTDSTEIPQFQKSFKHDPSHMPFLPFSSPPTPFRAQGLYPYLLASMATWRTLAIWTGTEVRLATCFRGSLSWDHSLFHSWIQPKSGCGGRWG